MRQIACSALSQCRRPHPQRAREQPHVGHRADFSEPGRGVATRAGVGLRERLGRLFATLRRRRLERGHDEEQRHNDSQQRVRRWLVPSVARLRRRRRPAARSDSMDDTTT
jgi:hypothetical protein